MLNKIKLGHGWMCTHCSELVDKWIPTQVWRLKWGPVVGLLSTRMLTFWTSVFQTSIYSISNISQWLARPQPLQKHTNRTMSFLTWLYRSLAYCEGAVWFLLNCWLADILKLVTRRCDTVGLVVADWWIIRCCLPNGMRGSLIHKYV